VDCNSKFGYSAETTLNLIQQLYEQKLTTYPRVDTTFLSDDVYPKCPQIMNGLFQTKFNGLAPYAELVRPLGGKSLPKSKKVFDSSKVTDHHAIIPTGVPPQGLSDAMRHVYDLIARRFIAVFYPDCKFAQTTVLGTVGIDTPDAIDFKVTGRTILAPGWRTVYATSPNLSEREEQDNQPMEGKGEVEERTLPAFQKGESGPHTPTLTEKMTTQPPYYTEATLLRAMETAGKTVDNDELREAMKENGIGRPSTRAAIIEKLYQRKYIVKQGKSLRATETGINLIHLIVSPLLKSAELTGLWEKKLREIERGEYTAQDFLTELKEMTSGVVRDVKTNKAGMLCPVCRQGLIIRGNTRYGCSRWKEGCNYAEAF
jgi:DNA topoisomerase-3